MTVNGSRDDHRVEVFASDQPDMIGMVVITQNEDGQADVRIRGSGKLSPENFAQLLEGAARKLREGP